VCCALAGAAWFPASVLAQDASMTLENDPRSHPAEAGGLGPTAPTQAAPGSVIIEVEPISEPTIDELMRGFRDVLERDRRPLRIVEHHLAGGIIEIDTRYGRFCLAPLPTYVSTSLTTSGGLTSFCSPY
jgi:hypothetical protein